MPCNNTISDTNLEGLMIPLKSSRIWRTPLLIGSRKLKTPCYIPLSVKIGTSAKLGQCMGCFNDHNKEKYFHIELTSTIMHLNIFV